jgi:hypothetical protein
MQRLKPQSDKFRLRLLDSEFSLHLFTFQQHLHLTFSMHPPLEVKSFCFTAVLLLVLALRRSKSTQFHRDFRKRFKHSAFQGNQLRFPILNGELFYCYPFRKRTLKGVKCSRKEIDSQLLLQRFLIHSEMEPSTVHFSEHMET